MSNSGYSRLYRDYLESDLWLAEPFTKGQAWVDLFSLANHKQQTLWIRGVEIVVERGVLARSELTLAKRWQWSRDKVRRFLKWLENNQQIRQQKTNVTSLIYIINYDRYNSNDTPNDTPNNTAEKHQTIQQKNTKQYTNKHDKHYKHEITTTPLPPKQQLEQYCKLKADEQLLSSGVYVKLCEFLKYREQTLNNPIFSKKGIDYLVNGAVELRVAGYDVEYCVDDIMAKNGEWIGLKAIGHNGKSTPSAESPVYVSPKTSAELDAEVERLINGY